MKKVFSAIVWIGILLSLCGCGTGELSTQKIRDIDFTVVKEEEIPEELAAKIKEKRETVMKLTFSDRGELYIVEGYGKQPTSGYSIEVRECYETANAVYFHTNLIGPSKEERIVEKETCPYIVVKMEYVDKNVVFQ